MNDCGQRISELRKKNNLTQLELGNKLNVTAQAVSKWETGTSEPDIETLKKISTLFNVSLDELLSNETAATTTATVQEQAAEKPAPERVVVAKCERCGKEVAAGEYSVALIQHTEGFGARAQKYTTQHIYCHNCYAQYQKEEHAKMIAEKKQRAAVEKQEIDSNFRKGTIWGILAAVVAVIAVIVAGIYVPFSTALTIILSVVAAYAFFALVFQCFFDGYVLGIMDFFTRSFHLPGLIFTLDLDGIIWLITVKLTLSILCGLLSFFIFIIGVVVAAVCSIFTFPFAMKKNIENKKLANSNLEAANNLK